MRKLSYRHKLQLRRIAKWVGLTALVLTVLMVFFLIKLSQRINRKALS